MSRFVALIAVAVSLVAGNAAWAGCWPFHCHCCPTCNVVPKSPPSADQFVNGELMSGIQSFPYPNGWCNSPFGDVAPSFPSGGMFPSTVLPGQTFPASAPGTVPPPPAANPATPAPAAASLPADGSKTTTLK
jgi:hypothetical protein